MFAKLGSTYHLFVLVISDRGHRQRIFLFLISYAWSKLTLNYECVRNEVFPLDFLCAPEGKHKAFGLLIAPYAHLPCTLVRQIGFRGLGAKGNAWITCCVPSSVSLWICVNCSIGKEYLGVCSNIVEKTHAF